MNFKKATDTLFSYVKHSDLAESLGVSVPSIRQARLREDAKAYREPPKEWRRAVIRLAEERIGQYRRLIEEVRQSNDQGKISG